jgi:TRAP-type C4-dicarboxylate transport system permease large subunit
MCRSLIILGPLLTPIAAQYGMDISHYSMLMILAMGVGIFIPPIGIGFYVSCTVSEAASKPPARQCCPTSPFSSSASWSSPSWLVLHWPYLTSCKISRDSFP